MHLFILSYCFSFPPLPIVREVDFSELSPHTKSLLQKHGMKCPSSSRLIADLRDKKHVKLHISYLQVLMEIGAEVTHLYRVVRFDQSPWLKSFVETNTKCRNLAKDDFSKNYFKLCINSQYGEL